VVSLRARIKATIIVTHAHACAHAPQTISNQFVALIVKQSGERDTVRKKTRERSERKAKMRRRKPERKSWNKSFELSRH